MYLKFVGATGPYYFSVILPLPCNSFWWLL